MEKVENLNKENFFNRKMKECPKAMESFCKFVDEYKESVDWIHLFADMRDFKPQNMQGGAVVFKQRKFHDIPIELQYGPIVKWLHIHIDGNTLEIAFPDDARAREAFIQSLDGYMAVVEAILSPDEKD